MRVSFSHNVVFIFDSAEKAPGNDWTEEHVQQGFARRSTVANFLMPIEGDVARIDAATNELLDRCDHVVMVSLLAESGTVLIGSVAPDDQVIWTGRPGWVRVTVGQMRPISEQEVRLVLQIVETTNEEPSRVRKGGQWLERDLVETAVAAKF